MPARTPKRASNKRGKPRPLTHSLGSSSGARGNPPSKQPQLGGGSDADGSATGCSRHTLSPGKDHLMDKDHEALTEDDVANCVRRAREFLEEHGPAQEEELCGVVGSRLAHGVRASFRSLAACLAEQPGFHLMCEGEYSFVYYLDPKESDVTSSRGELAESRGAAVGDWPRSGQASPSSSSGSGSYASALDKLEEERMERTGNAGTQTAFGETLSSCQSHGVQVGRGTQTSGYSPEEIKEMRELLKKCERERRLLRARIACLEADFGQAEEYQLDVEGQQAASHSPPPPEQPCQEEDVANGLCSEEKDQEGRNASSLSGGGVASGACLREKDVEEESWQAVWALCQEDPLTMYTDEESLPEPAVKPRHKPAAPLAKFRGKALNDSAECPQVPEFAELHWHLEQSRARTSSDRESVRQSSQGGLNGSTHKSKSEDQLAKIVELVKKKVPYCSEEEIRSHVEQVRCLQGGFTQMTLRDIVVLVLSHMKNVSPTWRCHLMVSSIRGCWASPFTAVQRVQEEFTAVPQFTVFPALPRNEAQEQRKKCRAGSARWRHLH